MFGKLLENVLPLKQRAVRNGGRATPPATGSACLYYTGRAPNLPERSPQVKTCLLANSCREDGCVTNNIQGGFNAFSSSRSNGTKRPVLPTTPRAPGDSSALFAHNFLIQFEYLYSESYFSNLVRWERRFFPIVYSRRQRGLHFIGNVNLL